MGSPSQNLLSRSSQRELDSGALLVLGLRSFVVFLYSDLGLRRRVAGSGARRSQPTAEGPPRLRIKTPRASR